MFENEAHPAEETAEDIVEDTVGAGRGTHAGEEHFALFATLFTYFLFFSSHPTC